MQNVWQFLSKYRLSGGHNRLAGSHGVIISFVAISWSVFQFYTAYFPVMAMYQRVVHVAFAMILIFCIYPLRGEEKPETLSIHGVLLSAIAIGISIYLANVYVARADTMGLYASTLDLVLGGIFIVLVLDICRRTTGWPFTIVAVVLLVYSRWGEFGFLGEFVHKNYDVERIITGLTMTTEGVYGSLTGVSATFIYIFILFGSFLRNTGAGDFFLDISNAILGKRRGGAAKVAVVASSMFGMVSGSALANVAGTGQFTIPLMKRTGYPPHFAGAVEAVSSSGGQILPPIMGGAAFVMMEFLGVSYLAICIAALLTGILYYVAAFVMVDVEAAKIGLKGLEQDEIPSIRQTLLQGWHYVIPIILLVYCLAAGFSATRAAFWATLAIPVCSLFKKKGRITLPMFFNALEDAAYTATSIVGIIAAMGIVVGMITLTGLGLNISTILINLAGGNLLILLFLTMITSIVLGMGVPILCAYIVLAVLVCPALVSMGIPPIAAHFFVFYYAVISAITPPVAPAAFIAANIAQAPMMKTAFTACKIGIGLLILPFVLVFDTGLLMQGSALGIIMATFRSIVIISAFICAAEGYLWGRISYVERILLFAGSIVLVSPLIPPMLAGYGLVGLVVLRKIVVEMLKAKRLRVAGGNL